MIDDPQTIAAVMTTGAERLPRLLWREISSTTYRAEPNTRAYSVLQVTPPGGRWFTRYHERLDAVGTTIAASQTLEAGKARAEDHYAGRLGFHGQQPDPEADMLVRAAATAQEMFGDDELERWAAIPKCESCGEAEQEHRGQHAGLCGDCFGRSLSDVIKEATGDHICGHPIYEGGRLVAICVQPHGIEHEHGIYILE